MDLPNAHMKNNEKDASMLSNIVDKNENLYRVVKRSKPEHMSCDRKPMPGLFKDSKGVSVDRDGNRNLNEIIHFMRNNFGSRTKAVGELSAKYCYEIGAEIEASPSNGNPFHANIFLSDNERQRNIQALKLADRCNIVYFDESVEWNYSDK